MANEITTQTNGTAVAAQNAIDPYLKFGSSGSRIVGSLLRFSKNEWTKGQEETPVSDKVRIIIAMSTMKLGWLRWQDNAIADEDMVAIVDSLVPGALKTRDQLGYTDESEWDVDEATSKKRDPWQNSIRVLMREEESGDVLTYSTSSGGGRDACKKIATTYGMRRRSHPNDVPVVTLGSEFYIHPIFKKIWKPTFVIVAWADAATAFAGADLTGSGAPLLEAADEVQLPTNPKGKKGAPLPF